MVFSAEALMGRAIFVHAGVVGQLVLVGCANAAPATNKQNRLEKRGILDWYSLEVESDGELQGIDQWTGKTLKFEIGKRNTLARELRMTEEVFKAFI